MTIKEFFKQNNRAALAFSGGTDSSYLLYAGLQSGCDLRPYFVKTPFQPEFELEDAQKLAAQLNVPLTILRFNVLEFQNVAKNDEQRCYYCKNAIFSLIQKAAKEDGLGLIIDGTNASDDAGDRPGMKALSELGVRSPLREGGLTKADIRRLSREAGLFTWDKPAYACLATRVPTGTPIDEKTLLKVEEAEGNLFALGFTDFRVRLLGNAAKLQFPEDQLLRAVSMKSELLRALSSFDDVLIDLKGRA
jgi:pyridinium-3,5-biscarboxylic acid mononucleotide sulfurtransferase